MFLDVSLPVAPIYVPYNTYRIPDNYRTDNYRTYMLLFPEMESLHGPCSHTDEREKRLLNMHNDFFVFYILVRDIDYGAGFLFIYYFFILRGDGT